MTRPSLGIASLAVSAACLLLASVGASAGRASILVAKDARAASLHVDAAGDAEVTWAAANGVRRSLVITRTGVLRSGERLPGRDVSQPVTGLNLPIERALRQTPDGALYALQAWRRLPSGPVELRFSRWRGAPTTLTLRAVCCKWGTENVVGEANLQGRPIFGYRSTPQGVPLDPYGRNVYLDSYRDGRWERMMGILTHRPTGSFSLWIRPGWLGSRYRGTMIGPNWGWTLGPDAQAEASSSRLLRPSALTG